MSGYTDKSTTWVPDLFLSASLQKTLLNQFSAVRGMQCQGRYLTSVLGAQSSAKLGDTGRQQQHISWNIYSKPPRDSVECCTVPENNHRTAFYRESRLLRNMLQSVFVPSFWSHHLLEALSTTWLLTVLTVAPLNTILDVHDNNDHNNKQWRERSSSFSLSSSPSGTWEATKDLSETDKQNRHQGRSSSSPILRVTNRAARSVGRKTLWRYCPSVSLADHGGDSSIKVA